MLADWIVIPLSRSVGRKSVVVLPVSTDPGADIYEEACRIDSVSVVLPESVGRPRHYSGEEKLTESPYLYEPSKQYSLYLRHPVFGRRWSARNDDVVCTHTLSN
jgi:hypothetical protein